MLDYERDSQWYVRSDVLLVDVTWQDASALSDFASDHALLEVDTIHNATTWWLVT